MPTFSWEAVTREGEKRSGELDAQMRAEVLTFLHREHLLPISVTLKKKQRALSFSLPFFGGTISQVDAMTLARHLSVMIQAGLGIVEIFEILIEDTEKRKLRDFFVDTRRNLERGQPLWTSFNEKPDVFPPYAIGLVRAGEASGGLDKALEEVARAMQRDYESRRRVMSALLYPAILFGAAFFLLMFLFFFALPKLAEAFLQTGVELPLFTRIIFSVGKTVGANPVIPAVFVGAVVLFTGFFLFTRRGKNVFARAAWQFSPTRSLIKKFILSRFAATLAGLLSAGLPVMEALAITADSVRFPLFREKILGARENVKRGTTLSDAFRQYPELFPRVLTSMMAVGERSGQLSDLLRAVSRFYEEEAERHLQTLIGLIEPMMLIGMGLLVGFIAISVLLPIYQFVTSI